MRLGPIEQRVQYFGSQAAPQLQLEARLVISR